MTALGTDEPAKWHVDALPSLPHRSSEAAVVAVADVKPCLLW